MSADSPNLLVIILDTDVVGWNAVQAEAASAGGQQTNPDNAISLRSVVDSMIVLVNAYKLQHRDNQIAVIASNPDGTAQFLFHQSVDGKGDKFSEAAAMDLQIDSTKCSQSKLFSTIVRHGVRELAPKLEECIRSGAAPKGGIAAALSMALCYCNSRKNPQDVLPPSRILLLQASGDESIEYIASINAAFAAQKEGILIDAFLAHAAGSTILQQVCHLTEGIFLQPKVLTAGAISQYLVNTFLPSAETRKVLASPMQPPVPLKASCFCHGRLVDKGTVCSTCLSVFCDEYTGPKYKCATCGTKVRIGLPVKKKAKAK